MKLSDKKKTDLEAAALEGSVLVSILKSEMLKTSEDYSYRISTTTLKN